MYSPLGLVIFVAVERTFVCFTKGHDHFISNSIRCGCLRTDQKGNVISRARKAAVNRNALAIDRRPPARRRRTVPCDLRHLPALTSIYQHLPAFTSIYQHLPAFTSIYQHLPAFTSIYQHLPAFTSPRLLPVNPGSRPMCIAVLV